MTDSTYVVRADIDATRERMSKAISALEQKVDIGQKVRDNPWPAVALAFGAGLALSATRADVRTGRVGIEAVQKTGSSLGSALDNLVAGVLGGVTAAFKGRIDDALHDIVTSVTGSAKPTIVSRTPSLGDLSHQVAGGGSATRAD